jgi:hypothetical protein
VPSKKERNKTPPAQANSSERPYLEKSPRQKKGSKKKKV